MSGFYVGLAENTFVSKNIASYIPEQLRAHIGLGSIWEVLFCAQHGSTKSYIKTPQRDIKPTFYDVEPRSQEEQRKIEQVQQGALNFVRIAKSGICAYPFDGGAASQNILIAGRYPRNIELSLLADFLFFDVGVFPLAKPESLFEYVRHPQNFKRDFANSTWRIGFMKRLFKLPLPYWAFYKVLRRLVKGT